MRLLLKQLAMSLTQFSIIGLISFLIFYSTSSAKGTHIFNNIFHRWSVMLLLLLTSLHNSHILHKHLQQQLWTVSIPCSTFRMSLNPRRRFKASHLFKLLLLPLEWTKSFGHFNIYSSKNVIEIFPLLKSVSLSSGWNDEDDDDA